MKKLYTILILLFIIVINNNVYGQQIGDLNGIYYQAVAVDENGKEIVGMDIKGKPLYNKEIGVRFTITKGLNGPVEWEETHVTNTDSYGLFNLIIGHGQPTGNALYTRMLDIPWIDADQFLKVEIAIKNDNNYKLVSNQQFMSVPYSFYTDDIADDAITTNKILNETILNEDLADDAVTTEKILNETILNEDLADDAVTTEKILNQTIINEDIADNAITSNKILNQTIINEDIADNAITSNKILNQTIINEDIADNAITSNKILNQTIINEDIADNAITSNKILNQTIINEDIADNAITSNKILNQTIINEDIADNAITSNKILNQTILNEDIANGTIDLTTKVTNTLPVTNGGTGNTSLTTNGILLGNGIDPIQSLGEATDGQIPIGVTGDKPVLSNITAGVGISVINTPGGITIASTITSGVNSNANASINVGLLNPSEQWLSQAFVLQQPVDLDPIEMGDILIASTNIDMQGCLMNVYLTDVNNGVAHARVVIFNPGRNAVTLGNNILMKILVVK